MKPVQIKIFASSEIKEWKEYETHNHGRVRVLKKSSAHIGDKPGQTRVKKLPSGDIEFIENSEFIIPDKKKPLTGAEKKRRSRQVKKEAGLKEVQIEFNKGNIKLLDSIKEVDETLTYSDIVGGLVSSFSDNSIEELKKNLKKSKENKMDLINKLNEFYTEIKKLTIADKDQFGRIHSEFMKLHDDVYKHPENSNQNEMIKIIKKARTFLQELDNRFLDSIHGKIKRGL